MREITEALFALRDEKYCAFHATLMPGVAWERVIGVRMPALRRYAAALAKTPQAALFLRELPHTYYEENNLHALLLMREKSFEALMPWLERFLPRIDNWATCDLLKPVCFAKNREKLLPCVTRWLAGGCPPLHRPLRHRNADDPLPAGGFFPGVPGLGGRGGKRSLLHPHDAGVVFRHGARLPV